MRKTPSYSISIAAVSLLITLVWLAACAPSGRPVPATLLPAAPTATATISPTPPSATVTATLPAPQFPDTPTPPDTEAPTVTPTTPPTPTEAPTVTPTPLAGDYQLNLIYQWSAENGTFAFTESINATAQFTVAMDGTLAGSGSGVYTQGLSSKNPNLNCGFPLNVPIQLQVLGKTAQSQGQQLLHIQVAVEFHGTATANMYCQAGGMRIAIAPVAPVGMLTGRAADLPWSDFKINTTLGLFSTLYSGPGIDWKPAGSGDVTIRIKPLK